MKRKAILAGVCAAALAACSVRVVPAAGVGLPTGNFTKVYIDGSANSIDTATAEMTFVSTGVPGGVTLLTLSNGSLANDGIGTGLNGETIEVGVTDDEFSAQFDGSSGAGGATSLRVDGHYSTGDLVAIIASHDLTIASAGGDISLVDDTLLSGNIGVNRVNTGRDFNVAQSSGATTIQFESFSATNTIGASLTFIKSDNNTLGTFSETDSGDILGQVIFNGTNAASSAAQGAVIDVRQSGAIVTFPPTTIEMKTSGASAVNDNQFFLNDDGTAAFGTDAPGAKVEVEIADAANVIGLLIDQNEATNDNVAVQIDAVEAGGTPLYIVPRSARPGSPAEGHLFWDSDDNALFGYDGSAWVDMMQSSSGGNADTLDSLDSTAFAILAGQAGGQTIQGGTASGEDLTLEGSSHATNGDVLIQPTDGKVAIGPGGAPAYLVDVNAKTGLDAVLNLDTTDTNNSTSDAELYFSEGGVLNVKIWSDGSDDGALNIDHNLVAGIEIHIDGSTGYIGLAGDTSPSKPVDIAGDTQIQGDLTVTGDLNVTGDITNGTTYVFSEGFTYADTFPYDLTAEVKAYSRVTKIIVDVTTAFDGGWDADIGTSADPNGYLDDADCDWADTTNLQPDSGGTQGDLADFGALIFDGVATAPAMAWTGASTTPVRITKVAGTPTQGAATIYVMCERYR